MPLRRTDAAVPPRRAARRLAFDVLLVGLLAGLLVGCFRPPERPPPRPTFSGHRVRLLGEADEMLGSFRVRRRSVAVNDAQGKRIGRASAFLDRVEVLNRLAEPVWLFRLTPSEGTGQPEGRLRRARIERGDGELVGFLEITSRGAIVRNANGVQMGEARVVDAEGTGRETVGELYGAPGTDLLGRVVASGPRALEVKDLEGAPFARLDGLELDRRAAGLMLLPPPGIEDGDTTPELPHLYQAGVLLFVRVYGDRDEGPPRVRTRRGR
jgi:hypothetical protein